MIPRNRHQRLNIPRKQNVIWGGNDGLVADGFLFDTDSVISGSKTSAVLEPDAPYYIPGAGTTSQSPGPNTEYAHFPAIPKLGDNSTLSAKAMLWRELSCQNAHTEGN